MSSQQAARVSSQSPGTWDRSSASSMPKSEGKGFRRGNSTILTFVDTVVSHEAFTDRLLLRELVHVVQYERLGLKEFAANYVTGFLSGGSYEAIPLEMNAHELDDRCAAAGRRLFPLRTRFRGGLIPAGSSSERRTRRARYSSHFYSRRGPSYSCVAMLGNHVRRHLWVAAQTAAQTLP